MTSGWRQNDGIFSGAGRGWCLAGVCKDSERVRREKMDLNQAYWRQLMGFQNEAGKLHSPVSVRGNYSISESRQPHNHRWHRFIPSLGKVPNFSEYRRFSKNSVRDSWINQKEVWVFRNCSSQTRADAFSPTRAIYQNYKNCHSTCAFYRMWRCMKYSSWLTITTNWV